jgi:DNA invertase Pin-like site-specific DNA recombinase
MKGHVVGYIRVSSYGQNTDRQLSDVALDKIFEEKASAKDTNRPVLQECLDYLREGDELHVHSIDRLARNLVDLQTIVTRLNSKGVACVFHKENLTFTGNDENPMNKLMLQMMGAFAEFERNLIRERQREGIAQAVKNGKKIGRSRSLAADQVAEIKNKVASGAAKADIAKEFGISRPTLYAALTM